MARFITRKFIAWAGTIGLMFVAWVLSNWLAHARDSLGALLTGLGAALAAFLAGNVAQDHVLRGQPVEPPEPVVEPVPEDHPK